MRTRRGRHPKNLEKRTSRRRGWSTVSKATERARRMKIEKRPLDWTVKRSLVTLERAVLVE